MFLIYPAIANRISDFVNKALKTRSADLLECRKLLREHTQVAIAVATKIWPAASVAPEPRGAAPSTPKITYVANAAASLIANWCDDEAIRPLQPASNPLREAWHLAGKIVVGYSGIAVGRCPLEGHLWIALSAA